MITPSYITQAARALGHREAARLFLDAEAYCANHEQRLREDIISALNAGGVFLRHARAQNKIAKRDKKIAGMARRIRDLERRLASRSVTVTPNELAGAVSGMVEGSIKRAMANMRLVPVLGIGGGDKVVEVREAPAPQGEELRGRG